MIDKKKLHSTIRTPSHDVGKTSEPIRLESREKVHKETVLRPIEPAKEVQTTKKTPLKLVIAVYGVLLLVGIGTGYQIARMRIGVSGAGTSTGVGVIENSKDVVGVKDEKTFKDSAEGTLEIGGIDGEGSHKLIREGGPSQTAYLISSVVDLDSFAGKKVRVWGQTIAAQKASWLMDVGKVEVLSQ